MVTMKIRVIAESNIENQYPVKLEYDEVTDTPQQWVVTYGASVKRFYGAMAAVKEYDECLRHAMRCAGYLE